MKYSLDGKLSIQAENARMAKSRDAHLQTKHPGKSAALQACKEGIQRFLLGTFESTC